MALKKKPVNGMKDVLPDEALVRDYVTGIIKDTYRKFGFTPIETPLMEDIGNLSNKQGGENEKLIFKVLKRGEKLHLDTAETEADVVDYGMRYDLTVPLSRFYANNENDLPKPFKALQIGPVFRADRPQRGRYRQFTQCDIDILGEPSNLAEIELISATTAALGNIGFKGFAVHINERRILKEMAFYAGFPEEDFDEVFIILDKMDKIGLEGVEAELTEAGYSAESVDKYTDLFKKLDGITKVSEGLSVLKGVLGDFYDDEVGQSLTEIETAVSAVASADFQLVFDPTLVRGMSYYTGTIFEIRMPELGISCGGGGRYDNMVGLFAGHPVPACGFSIGFERIILILMEQGFTVPGSTGKTAFLIDKKCSPEIVASAMKEAAEKRAAGETVLVTRRAKNVKFQKDTLTAEGYSEFKDFYAE